MIEETSDLWWKNALFYCADVKTYLDADGDGMGDLKGLTAGLDHLADLGVACLWLMPVHPSPGRDDGYDVADYYGIHPQIGSPGDFTEMMRTAADRGLRVMIDMVFNHTSVDHPWFQAARRDRSSPMRDYYVWCDEPPEDWQATVMFPNVEDGNWAYDEEAGQYYLHVFFGHQPDVNIGSPEVREEMARILGFWLQQGVCGFRIDAVPHLLDARGLDPAINLDPHDLLADLRQFLGRRRGDAVLLGEVNLPPEELITFVGEDRDEQLQMVFNFSVNQAMYLALARQSAEPLVTALERLPVLPAEAQWANFARNHDELTLDQLTDSQRQEVFAAFGPDDDHQLFDRGLRRRVPSMFGGDRRRLELVYSLVFGLPGTPVLFYGEEIGMAENLALEGRKAVRTPMQWAPGPGGGFTRPDVEPFRPFPEEPWSPDEVNVVDQADDPTSFLQWMVQLARRRRVTPQIGWGSWEVVDLSIASVLALRFHWNGSTVFTVFNLGEGDEQPTLELEREDQDAIGLLDLLDRSASVPVHEDQATVELGPFGYRWFRVISPDDRSL